MYFKRIEMQGFKSFADPVTIDLNEGITCIIGPNGSGKSNISDALRWVLGEQSSKQLRGSKMQDVIFAGTATRKPKGMAEVTLVIDNSTGILPLEYREVAVTRRMFRSGESEYLINGNQCRLRDVRELFMDTGIGVEGYSIIGQGKIADIVSTKPENRRQIFEEAAGVVLYKTRKAEAESKLKSATSDLERVRDIIAEIEGRIGGLRDDSEKASEYLVLRDRYKTLSINIILHNLENLVANLDSGRSELEEIETRLAGFTRRNDEIDAALEDGRLQAAELSEQYANLNADLLGVIDELNTLTSGGEINKERLANIDRDLARLENDKQVATEKLAAENEELRSLESKDRELSLGLDEIKQDLNEAIIAYTDHSRKSSKLATEIESLKDRMISLKNQNVKTEAEISTITEYKNVSLIKRRDELKLEFENRDADDSELRGKLTSLNENIAAKREIIDSGRARIAELETNIHATKSNIDSISKEIDNITTLSNQTTSRRNTIEEMEANYEGYYNAVKAVMRRGYPGIIGTVSDIIEVPAGYEVAIETALGAALQNIVCKTDSDAKTAINWLKSERAGKATFLPIESVKVDQSRRSTGVENAAGYIGIAADVARTRDEFRKVVEYLLCRVIIADNMDNAVTMSKLIPGGYRIVTMDGEVLNAFGSITGGRYANKTANLLDRKKEIGILSARIAEYSAKITELRSRIESENKIGASYLDEIEKLRSDITQSEIDYNVLKSDRDHAEELLRTKEAANEKYRNEISNIAEDIEKADAMIVRYLGDIDRANLEYKDAESRVEALIEEREALIPVIEGDNEAIVSLKVKIGESESKVLARNEIIEKVRDSVIELEAVIEDCNDSIEELALSKEALLSSSEDSAGRANELRLRKEELEARIREGVKASEANKLRTDELIAEQKELRQGLETSRDEKYGIEVKIARSETQIDAQKDKLWDEFEISYAEAVDMRDPKFAITSGNKESREIRLRLAEIGDVNIGAIEEYKAVSKRYEFMTTQEKDLTKAMDELNEIILNMDKTIRTKFKQNFDEVVVNFEESFKELFGGGYAELRLEDETKPLESGIEITAQPPGKKLKNINLLSGGEKTLTAIALMFAVLKAKPTPFVILDEVEAALDEVNIEHFSDYLRKFDNIQFALITHQKATMEHADVLYGVTMPEQGISKMLSLKLGDDFDTGE